jgi:benzaldehyde dehydrogenase (NAD)
MPGLIDLAAVRGLVSSDGWRRPVDAGVVWVTEPATGAVLAEVGAAQAADIDAAVRSAAAAQPAWAAESFTTRAAVLRRAAQVMADHRDEVAQWLVREGGSARPKAEFEIASALDELWTAAALPAQDHGVLQPSIGGGSSVARRVPLGVVGVIAPWNVPTVLALRALAPALALGNAVVLKPDARAAVSGGVLPARVFEEAGLPSGLLHVLPGDAGPGAALVAHPLTAAIAFTGSTAVGREVGAVAGRGLKRALLELGGNNAIIVLEDADLDAAASAGAWGSFLHQGQICMQAGRHLVHESVVGAYLERLTARAAKLTVGDPWTGPADLGPLIDGRQLARVARIVEDTVAAGAVLCTGGTHDGPFYRPTVLAGVTPEMPAFTQEIFGPVAPVVAVRDEDEAVALANDTEYGLVTAIQTGSVARAEMLADRLRTGAVHINDQTVNDDAVASFGGWGASGNGARFGARHSWDEFTRWQWVSAKHRAPVFPF